MDREGVIQHVKTIISINTYLLTDEHKVTDLVRESILRNLEISDYTINSMKAGICIPGVDKLFLLGLLLNADPREFIRPRTGKGFDEFLSLSPSEKRLALKLFEITGDQL